MLYGLTVRNVEPTPIRKKYRFPEKNKINRTYLTLSDDIIRIPKNIKVFLVGFIVYLIVTYIPMPAPFPQVIIVIVCVLIVLYLIGFISNSGVGGHYIGPRL